MIGQMKLKEETEKLTEDAKDIVKGIENHWRSDGTGGRNEIDRC